MQAIAARALRFLPSLAEAKIVRCYAGLRPWSQDHLPLIGPISKTPGLYIASGHEGAGICLAPISGQLIADWVTGAVSSLSSHEKDLADKVSPQRFNL